MDSVPLVQRYCLRWNDHVKNLLLFLEKSLMTETLTDVTLSCDGKSFKCHQVVLAACSSYFDNLFKENESQYPIVFLKDIHFSDVQTILEYMYSGEVNVAQDQLAGLLKAAESLKVKGLVEDNQSVSEKPFLPNYQYLNNNSVPDYNRSTAIINKSNATPTRRITGNTDSSFKSKSAPKINILPHHLCSSGSSASTNKIPASSSPKASISNISIKIPQSEPVPLKKKKVITNKDTAILKTVVVHANRQVNPENGTNPFKTVNYILPANVNHPTNGYTTSSDTNDTEIPRADYPENFLDISESSAIEKVHEDNNSSTLDSDGKNDGVIATSTPSKKGKRYKKYTRSDMKTAIDAVLAGMSCLQAGKVYEIPSRTLYDKVKKLGITTNPPRRTGSCPMSPHRGLSAAVEASSSYSPENQLEGSGEGSRNGDSNHGVDNQNDTADSEPGSSLKMDQNSPISEKSSNLGQEAIEIISSDSEQKLLDRSEISTTISSTTSSNRASPETMNFIELEGFMTNSDDLKPGTPLLNVC